VVSKNPLTATGKLPIFATPSIRHFCRFVKRKIDKNVTQKTSLYEDLAAEIAGRVGRRSDHVRFDFGQVMKGLKYQLFTGAEIDGRVCWRTDQAGCDFGKISFVPFFLGKKETQQQIHLV